ncbi:unnamed protein product [marine sediment metagenome]|uniref:Uncharacterized protein n=1 Tax=marine sediment metagenome TaxID=412755 RepID=X1LLI6_9ZZZZ
MGDQKTYQVRVLTEGLFDGLIKKIRNQFINKHGFKPKDKEICEVIAKAVIDEKLF